MALKAKLNIAPGSGNPVANPNFRPMNPWGRSMPKPERPPRPMLYQVIVRSRRKGKMMPIGPKWAKENAERVCHEISVAIHDGRETDWCDPIVIPISES